MQSDWANLLPAAIHSCTVAFTWCVVGVTVGTLTGVLYPFWRGTIFVLSVAECLAALPAILLAKTLASGMTDWTFAFWLVLLATVFPSAVQSAALATKSIKKAEPFFFSAGGNHVDIAWKVILPRLLPLLLNSLKILWPSALLLTLIAEYSGAQSPGGLGKMIIPLLTTGRDLWPFTIVTAGSAFLVYKILEAVEFALANRFRDLEDQPNDHFLLDLVTQSDRPSEKFRTRLSRVFVFRILPIALALFVWCVANEYFMFGRIDLFSLFRAMKYVVFNTDVASHLAITVLQTIAACLIATVVAALTAIVLGVLCTLHRGMHFFVAQGVLVFQVIPLIALLSIAKILLRDHPMFAGLLVVVSTVFYPVLETIISGMQVFLKKTLVLWKSTGSGKLRAMYHLGTIPLLSALLSGFQIAAPRTFSAAIIAGVIVVDFGLGSVVRRFNVGDVEKLNIVCAIVCIISIILADGFKVLPQLATSSWRRLFLSNVRRVS